MSPAVRELVDHDAEHGGDGNHKGHVLHHARNIDCDGGAQQELERERNRHGRYNRGRQDDGERERAVAAEHANPHKGSDCHGYAVLEHDAADKVEVWADGDWHYLGACEPEPVLDKGWFTAAASKAMLVHAKAFSDLESSAEIAYKTPLYALMNVTERYADCAKLTVTVTDHGVPVQNVSVLFCLVNYSELFPLHKEKTASDGSVSFMTGKGDLYVCTVYNGKYLGQKIDMREQQSVVLKMEQAADPEKMEGIIEERFDLNPPIEAMPKSTGAQMKSVHEARLAECEKIRADYEEGFVKEDKDSSDPWNRYFVNARGNRQELEKFRQMTEFTDEDKRLMLDTLRDKDFLDTTAEVLASYLRAALPYKNNFCTELYQKYLLAPRAGHEKLMGSRSRIVSLLSEKKVFPQDGHIYE